jgi:hypothetical protein
MSLSEKISKRTFPTRDVTVCLDGQLSQEREKALAAVAEANERKSDRLASDGGLKAALAKVAELEAAMRDSLVTIRVVGVPFALYNKIQHAHPPRKGHPEGFNPLTFFTDAIYESSLLIEADADPVPLTDTPRKDWDAFVDSLTDAEFSQLARAVTDVNNTGREFGFLGRISETIPDSSETSDSPETSE